MTNIELRAIWGLGVIFSLRMLGMFMMLPALATYGLSLQGANELFIGFAISVYGITQAIFHIPFGLASDHLNRKFLIIFSSLIFVFGSIVAALINNIWGVILGRAIQGIGTITAPVMALLSDLVREQNRIKAITLIGVSFGLTFMTAVVVGPIVAHAIGLSGLFFSISVLTIIGTLMILIVPTANYHVLNRESGIVRDGIYKILTNSQLLKLNIGIFCLHFILISNFIVIPSTMVHAGFLENCQWKVYSIIMLISFAIGWPTFIYTEAKRCMKRTFFCYTTLLLISEMMLLIASNHPWMVIAGIQLFFLAFNIMEILLPSFISQDSPIGYKGTAMGVYFTSQFLGGAFGGACGGLLFQLKGTQLVFLVGLLVVLICLLVSIVLCEPSHMNSLRIALSDYKKINEKLLIQNLKVYPGIIEVIVIPDEQSAYIKGDIRRIAYEDLKKIIISSQT
ncbi:MFS transporter [Sodalis sp. CWE]|uniref:MFS transporter n=1 Tax=Sodalis sp. CWE TaxID=2803816 RepID=UPI001C7DE5DC|nr:MFS transporter [Sodalis sp. CWE]MBX4181202.1 MFS transporter [Sodalis sp. CWE]